MAKVKTHFHDEICDKASEDAGERRTFRDDLENLINSHSMENGSDTPDFILANYLYGCLTVFDTALEDREKHYGRELFKDRPVKTVNQK